MFFGKDNPNLTLQLQKHVKPFLLFYALVLFMPELFVVLFLTFMSQESKSAQKMFQSVDNMLKQYLKNYVQDID